MAVFLWVWRMASPCVSLTHAQESWRTRSLKKVAHFPTANHKKLSGYVRFCLLNQNQSWLVASNLSKKKRQKPRGITKTKPRKHQPNVFENEKNIKAPAALQLRRPAPFWQSVLQWLCDSVNSPFGFYFWLHSLRCSFSVGFLFSLALCSGMPTHHFKKRRVPMNIEAKKVKALSKLVQVQLTPPRSLKCNVLPPSSTNYVNRANRHKQ